MPRPGPVKPTITIRLPEGRRNELDFLARVLAGGNRSELVNRYITEGASRDLAEYLGREE
jgi:hypothetical protein